MKLAIFFLLVILPAVVSSLHDYRDPFAFQCRSGSSVSYISSKYSSTYKDRKYNFSCRYTSYLSGTSCSWYSYISSSYGLKVFQCPRNSVISGVISQHIKSSKDRRFQFYCCNLIGKKLTSCSITDRVNGPAQSFSYSVPRSNVIRGVLSMHSPSYYDRLWRFIICRVR